MTDSAADSTGASKTRTSSASTTRPSSALRILLLDAEGHDRELSQDEFDRESLSDQRLVWIDMPSGSEDRDLARDRAMLEQLSAPEDALDALLEVVGRPRLFEYGDVMRLEVTGLRQPARESTEESKPVAVLCVVGPNWLVTVHDAPVAFLEEFRERVEGGSDLGDLDAVAFLATLLHWQLTSYDEEIRRIIATLDELEDQALRVSASQQETLEQLVSLRRRISRLRALLAPHESVFAQLARPEFDRLSTSESAEAFRTQVAHDLAFERGDVRARTFKLEVHANEIHMLDIAHSTTPLGIRTCELELRFHGHRAKPSGLTSNWCCC